MTISLKVLGSSSSGNCGLLIHRGCYYLIDAGFSGKKIREKLMPYGIALEDISGVFITHEHQDHCQGLRSLRKIKHIKFYANYHTAEAIEERYHTGIRWSIFESNMSFFIGDLEIYPFRISHDAIEPVCFSFKTQRQCCCWATDVGCITPDLANVLARADDLVLEANHDRKLLWEHPTRPQYLKERVAGTLGHLSNKEAFDFIKNAQHQFKTVSLVHISKDCNSIEKMRDIFQPLADKKHFVLEIVNPFFS